MLLRFNKAAKTFASVGVTKARHCCLANKEAAGAVLLCLESGEAPEKVYSLGIRAPKINIQSHLEPSWAPKWKNNKKTKSDLCCMLR